MVIPFQGLHLIASVNVLAQVGPQLQIFRSKGFGTDLGRVIIQLITAPLTLILSRRNVLAILI